VFAKGHAQTIPACCESEVFVLQTLLLNMPFVSLSRPAIGISILKARLAEEGIPCSVKYGNLLFAERVGVEGYALINDRLANWMFAGEWLFAEQVFPGVNRSSYIDALRENLTDHEFDIVMKLREEVGPFLEACFDELDLASYDIIGFTSTFEQNLASLALARLIKSRYPEKITVLGGGNCEGIMGLELHKQFSWIDYVCSGESENSFPGLVKSLSAGLAVTDLPGLVYRQNGESKLAAPPDRVHDMDRQPDPDYDDYFATLRSLSIGSQVHPSLLIESARGCWWGAKSHCTFCGLNGATLAFRAKSASRVYAELRRQKERYGIGHFIGVDNIMSYDYFRDLLPMLKENNPGITLFYEIKSNLKPAQVELLRDAGVTGIQPGVESLNSHVLQLMRKGVTGIQNVQLLRLCREYGLQLAWNLLYGFPGETPQDYLETGKVIEAVCHLTAPGAVARIRLDRFSPNFDSAENFGLVSVRPFAIYEHLYPLDREVLANIAYFFSYDYLDGRNPADYVQPMLEKMRMWQENQSGDLVKQYESDGELTVVDTRPGRKAMHYPLTGLQREIYDFCDQIRSRSNIEMFAAKQAGRDVPLDEFLEQLVSFQLMLQEGNQYLSLAVDPRRCRSSKQEKEICEVVEC
jgi:ribosomal peptide maturation radical SAM protein 1